ncbi:unnamed protein product [Clonostachys rosea f. rosea IK726]|uniref:Uncharacterized protein n=1 Tax=Clonostachys rosea f. rosea IK726 TaxID=1349383 RepID=A0ACA9U8D8_BIOOC|nr:unnamed protein product [Clonostachys rosea f. rosea IK726]
MQNGHHQNGKRTSPPLPLTSARSVQNDLESDDHSDEEHLDESSRNGPNNKRKRPISISLNALILSVSFHLLGITRALFLHLVGTCAEVGLAHS